MRRRRGGGRSRPPGGRPPRAGGRARTGRGGGRPPAPAGFGTSVGERPEPRAQPRGEDHPDDAVHGRAQSSAPPMSPATRLRLFYFAYYGGVGTLLPFFAPYLRGLGFTGEQIGTVQMIGPLAGGPGGARLGHRRRPAPGPGAGPRARHRLGLPGGALPPRGPHPDRGRARAPRLLARRPGRRAARRLAHRGVDGPPPGAAPTPASGSSARSASPCSPRRSGSCSPGAATGRATCSSRWRWRPAWAPTRSWPGRLPTPPGAAPPSPLPGDGRPPARRPAASRCWRSSPSTGGPPPRSTCSSASSSATWGSPPASPAWP